MGESKGVSPLIEETDAEIELSAQELIELSDLQQVEEREAMPVLQASQPAKSASPPKLRLSLVADRRDQRRWRNVCSLRACGWHKPRTQRILRNDWLEQNGHPSRSPRTSRVRFANPFDADEVFEFPAGTSETQVPVTPSPKSCWKRAMSRQKT